MADREGRRSPGSCGSAAGTGRSVNPSTSGSGCCRNGGAAVEEEVGSGSDRGPGTGRTGTGRERPSGVAEGGEMTGRGAESGMTAGRETDTGTGTGDDAHIKETELNCKVQISPIQMTSDPLNRSLYHVEGFTELGDGGGLWTKSISITNDFLLLSRVQSDAFTRQRHRVPEHGRKHTNSDMDNDWPGLWALCIWVSPSPLIQTYVSPMWTCVVVFCISQKSAISHALLFILII